MAGTRYPQDDPEEPPQSSRPRVGSRLWNKLDAIESKIEQALGGQTSTDGDGDGERAKPTVTFEADPADLPTAAVDEDEEPEEGAGTGEGTANLAYKKPPKHRFPHRRRVEVEA